MILQTKHLSTLRFPTECIPLNPQIKHKVSWKSEDVNMKRLELKKVAHLKDTTPTGANLSNCKMGQNVLKETYETDQA